MEDWSLDDLGDCLQELGWIAPSSHSFPASSRLSFISSYVDSLDKILRPINLTIHDHPELNYEEYIAHEALTSFLRTRAGWKVTSSAYGIATAFVAEFDSGREGPVISFNAEYGTYLTREIYFPFPIEMNVDLIFIQMLYLALDMPVAII